MPPSLSLLSNRCAFRLTDTRLTGDSFFFFASCSLSGPFPILPTFCHHSDFFVLYIVSTFLRLPFTLCTADYLFPVRSLAWSWHMRGCIEIYYFTITPYCMQLHPNPRTERENREKKKNYYYTTLLLVNNRQPLSSQKAKKLGMSLKFSRSKSYPFPTVTPHIGESLGPTETG